MLVYIQAVSVFTLEFNEQNNHTDMVLKVVNSSSPCSLSSAHCFQYFEQ